MGAVGYTSGDPNKVNVIGDTMTGDLILAGAGTDLTVGGVITDTYGGVTGDVMRLMSTAMSTGITSGGVLSINANPTLIDVSATSGWIYDYNPFGTISGTNPQMTFVNFAGQTGIALTGPPTQLVTFWLLNSAGTLIQQATTPTRLQYRTHLVIGVSSQFGGVINVVQSLATVLGQTATQLVGLMRGLGLFVIGSTSNVISPNAANLKIKTTGGAIFGASFGLPNYQDPNTASTAAQAPATFRYATATTILAPLLTDVAVANYDPGGLGVVTPIGGGANTSTIHRVYASPAPGITDQMAIQYGQTAYASLAAAVAAIGSGVHIQNPAFEGLPVAAWIVATRTAANLSDPTQASFTHASKFASP